MIFIFISQPQASLWCCVTTTTVSAYLLRGSEGGNQMSAFGLHLNLQICVCVYLFIRLSISNVFLLVSLVYCPGSTMIRAVFVSRVSRASVLVPLCPFVWYPRAKSALNAKTANTYGRTWRAATTACFCKHNMQCLLFFQDFYMILSKPYL